MRKTRYWQANNGPPPSAPASQRRRESIDTSNNRIIRIHGDCTSRLQTIDRAHCVLQQEMQSLQSTLSQLQGGESILTACSGDMHDVLLLKVLRSIEATNELIVAATSVRDKLHIVTELAPQTVTRRRLKGIQSQTNKSPGADNSTTSSQPHSSAHIDRTLRFAQLSLNDTHPAVPIRAKRKSQRSMFTGQQDIIRT